jgi:hypothetical protein
MTSLPIDVAALHCAPLLRTRHVVNEKGERACNVDSTARRTLAANQTAKVILIDDAKTRVTYRGEIAPLA